MRFSFGIYDFLGYMVPGLIVILMILIMINPEVLETRPFGADEGLAKYLPATAVQGILSVFVCYIAGLVSHGLINWLFSVLSDKWSPFKRYYSDRGAFERGLFYKQYRDNSKDFQPYSDQFVCKLRKQIERIFDIRVETIQCEAERTKENAKYTEIFHLCRTAFMKHSPDLYPRAANLLALYNCAKVLGGIFLLATVGFLIKIILSFSEGGTPDCILFVCLLVSPILCFILFYLYHLFFRYYRNSILYGFYEYAVHAEKSKDAETD